jgi:hypothetical protein
MANHKILEVNKASSTARFETDAQIRQPCRFSVPKREVCDPLGLTPQDEKNILVEVTSTKGVTKRNPTNLKSGWEIYGDGLKDACNPGERIEVWLTKI